MPMRAKYSGGRVAFFIFAGAMLSTPPVIADGSSKALGQGGRFAVYFPVIAKYNKSGERFRIEGECKSACTLFLSTRNVCIDRKASLFFHAGPDRVTHKRGPNSSSTRTMLAAYNPKLRKYLVDGHHVDSGVYHALTGSALIDKFGYAECKPNR